MGRGELKRAGERCVVDPRVTYERLVEFGRVLEHAREARGLAHVPVVQRDVEGAHPSKRGREVRHATHVPIGDVLVECSARAVAPMLCNPIGVRRGTEEVRQVSETAHIPCRDVPMTTRCGWHVRDPQVDGRSQLALRREAVGR